MDKDYYKHHRFYSNREYNIHNMISHQEEDIEYCKSFYEKYPDKKNEDLKIYEEELKKVELYKATLEEGIAFLKQVYF